MLTKLEIQNFAIIKDLKVDFQSGFTALIGETGAGKSILIDALAILLGARASAEMIRTGSSSSTVTGQFDIDNQNASFFKEELTKYGLPNLAEDTLLIQREITTKGRNTVRINGQLTTINILAELGKRLVDIHGQSDQQVLMDEDKHGLLLDQFGGTAITDLTAEYGEEYGELLTLKRQLQNVTKNVQELAQRKDILTFQVNEIEEAKLTNPEEDEEVDAELNKLNNYQKILETASGIQAILESEDQNVVDPVGQMMNDAKTLKSLSSDYTDLENSLQDAYYALDDSRSFVQKLLDELDFDEEHFQYLLARSDQLNQLKKKYGPTLADVFDFYEKYAKELQSLNDGDFNVEKLNSQIAAVESKLTTIGEKIHAARLKVATKLVQSIKNQLKDLYMEKAEFAVSIERAGSFLPNGIDVIQFMISPNPGEALKPLVKIASGGEQSRIMLAIKTIFGQLSLVKTMIFDEIDTGVSGRVAAAIGTKMVELAKSRQILTITHSPQVAAKAEHRLLINKQVKNMETFTELTALNKQDSIEAIAKMMAGNKVTDAAMQNAKDLLSQK